MLPAEKSLKKITAQDVAEYLLAFANEAGESITNLKLQKMLYYVQAWHLANFLEPLFDDEFEAWVHGPVLPIIYQQYREFSPAPIIIELDKKDIASRFSPRTLEFIKEVIKIYMPHGGYELELMTHQEDPWVKARKECEPDEYSSEVITKDAMRVYYGEKIKD